MRLLGWIVGVAVVLTAINYKSWKSSDEPLQNAAAVAVEKVNPFVAYEKGAVTEIKKLEIQMLKFM
jgi:hypothetical protein